MPDKTMPDKTMLKTMPDKKVTLICGLLGLLATVLVGSGEFLLHYSNEVVGHAENYQFFQYVSETNLITGHFIAIVGVPFYYVGYYHVYKMMGGTNNTLAPVTFWLGIIAFTIGSFWITSRAFLGTIVHLQGNIDVETYQQILANYTLISESLVQVLRVVILLLSLVFIVAVLKGRTYYKKWMVFFNPFLLLLLVFAIYFTLPSVGKYIGPIAMNVAHFVLFAVSLLQLIKLEEEKSI